MIQPLSLVYRGGSGEAGGVERDREFVDLVEILADHEDAFALVFGHELLHHFELRGSRGGKAVSGVVSGCRVFEPLLLGKVDAHFEALRRGDEPLRFDLLPGSIETFRPDQAEDIPLAAVFANESRSKPEAATGLEVGGEFEHGRGQEVHLVVDDEPPVERVEERQMRVLAFAAGGENLVGRDRDRLDLFDLTGILADLVLGESRALEELCPPLPRRHGVRHENQRRRLRRRHRPRADKGFSRAAGENDDP